MTSLRREGSLCNPRSEKQPQMVRCYSPKPLLNLRVDNKRLKRTGAIVQRTVFFLVIWLAPRAGKMNQMARCDWLPERARWSHLARSGLPTVSHKKNFPESHMINPLLTKFVRSTWLDIDLVLFLRVYGPRLRLGHITTQKNNLANIQPSWPHTDLVNNPYVSSYVQLICLVWFLSLRIYLISFSGLLCITI